MTTEVKYRTSQKQGEAMLTTESKIVCVFCGNENAETPIIFPSTFTAHQFLQAGNKACSRCAEMFTDPKYRRGSRI